MLAVEIKNLAANKHCCAF